MFGFGLGTSKITKEHLIGAAIGVGVTVAGYYLYKKNKNKVDDFLRSQGINVKSCNTANYEDMSIEELTETKEHIEDILAEKELNGETCVACEASGN